MQTNLKKVTTVNNDMKTLLEDVESYILSTSESINDRIEDIHR